MRVVELVVTIVVVVIAFLMAVAPLTISESFIEVFQEFGTMDELPMLTQVCLSPWYGLSFSLVVFGLLIVSWVYLKRTSIRRGLIISSILVEILGLMIYAVGMYSPLFEVIAELGP